MRVQQSRRLAFGRRAVPSDEKCAAFERVRGPDEREQPKEVDAVERLDNMTFGQVPLHQGAGNQCLGVQFGDAAGVLGSNSLLR
jgi:hypothetical protein